MTRQQRAPYYTRRTYRTVSTVFGLLLMVVAGYLVLSRSAGAIQVTVSLVIFAAGANLILSAYRGTESWISKIGPLP